MLHFFPFFGPQTSKEVWLWRSFAGKLSDNLDTSVKQGTRLTGILGPRLEGPSHRSSNRETNGEIAETPDDEMGSRKERPHLILWTAPPPARDRRERGRW